MTPQPPKLRAQIVVLEGAPLGTPTATGFDSIEQAEPHVVARVRELVNVVMRARLETALVDRIVSEDGVKAVSEVLTSKLEFLRAVAKAYAPKITITAHRPDEDDDQ